MSKPRSRSSFACRARSIAPTTDAREAAYARLLTPAAKFWICKLAPGFVFEAMESLGGNGYVEESILPRLYREGPVNAIWEGSGNVMCLDVLRALKGKDEADLFADLVREAGLAIDAENPQSSQRGRCAPHGATARALWPPAPRSNRARRL